MDVADANLVLFISMKFSACLFQSNMAKARKYLAVYLLQHKNRYITMSDTIIFCE